LCVFTASAKFLSAFKKRSYIRTKITYLKIFSLIVLTKLNNRSVKLTWQFLLAWWSSCCYKPCLFCIVFWLFSCSALWPLQYSKMQFINLQFTLPWEFEKEGCYIILSGGWLLCFCSCSEYKLWGKMCNVYLCMQFL
jgi:hypothetical protein